MAMPLELLVSTWSAMPGTQVIYGAGGADTLDGGNGGSGHPVGGAGDDTYRVYDQSDMSVRGHV